MGWGYGENAHVYTAAFFCSTMIARGDLDAARAGLMSREVDTTPVSDGVRYWLEARGRLLLAGGRYGGDPRAAGEEGAQSPHGSFPPASRWRACKALALHALGRSDEAVGAASEELTLAR